MEKTMATPAFARRLTHLEQLEAESIHIMREVVAECEKPVMLYSIGKDSAVMLHLALKAFHPGKLPFPLMHVDTTWKFRDMITFRDRMAAEKGFDLIVHINQDGVAKGVNPLKRRWTNTVLTQPLAARAATRKNPVPKNASSPSATAATAGTPRTSAQNCGASTMPA